MMNTWMSQEGSKWLVNGLYPTYKWGILGISPTDPNLLAALPTGHPSRAIQKSIGGSMSFAAFIKRIEGYMGLTSI